MAEIAIVLQDERLDWMGTIHAVKEMWVAFLTIRIAQRMGRKGPFRW